MQTLRLCTWNIHLGLELDLVLEAVRTRPEFAGLDLLALQEVSLHGEQPDARALAQALGPRYDICQVTAHWLGPYAQANAIVWNTERVRVAQTDTVKLPRLREVKLSRAERTVLSAFPQQSRIAVVADGAFGDESLRVYAAHLDVLGIAFKRAQFVKIVADARERAPRADITLVAGDLNTFHVGIHRRWKTLADAAQAAGFQDLTTEIEWTHQAGRRLRWRQKLDAIFIRRDRPVRYHSAALEIPGSDHLPVFAQIELG